MEVFSMFKSEAGGALGIPVDILREEARKGLRVDVALMFVVR